MDKKELLVREEYRRDTYKFLSLCFFLPDQDLVNELGSPMGGSIAEKLGLDACLFKNLDSESLRIDYSQLFIGPYQLLAPPYGSIYLESTGTVMGESTLDAKRRYESSGLNLTMKDAPDHIAIELEFMYVLIHQEVVAIKSADEPSAFSSREQQMSFLNIHLGAWIPQLSKKIIENAQTEFYKAIAKSCQSFVIEHRLSLAKELATAIK